MSTNKGYRRGTGKTVSEIVVDRLIQKIQSEQRLPWQKPFYVPSMNWYSQREYTGINRFLLGGGEFITFKQLMMYNAKKGTKFSVKGVPWEIVVFYTVQEKIISEETAQRYIERGFGDYVYELDDKWLLKRWILRYYRVFNILDIPPDEYGNRLEPRIGREIFEVYTPAEEIVKTYIQNSKVKIIPSPDGGAWYSHKIDAVAIPDPRYFKSSEAYYRTLFHELIHSTGVEWRLNRPCFKEYHNGLQERSREELIAEIGSLLLATEAGFRDDSFWANNSLEYIRDWCEWMKEHKKEVLNGMLAAEKAKNYIMSGGVTEKASSVHVDGVLQNEEGAVPDNLDLVEDSVADNDN